MCRIASVLILLLASVLAKAADHPTYLLHYLIDENQALNFEQVRALPSQDWNSSHDTVPSLGFLEKPVWFRVTIENLASLPEQYVALVDYAPLDRVELFVWESDLEQLEKYAISGDHQPASEREIKYPGYAFWVPNSGTERDVLYFRLESTGNITFPLSLHTDESFGQKRQSFLAIYGVITGAMLVTVFYNLVVFFRTREPLFLYFSGFAAALSFLFSVQSGIAFTFVWPKSISWNEFSILLAILLTGISHHLFSIRFLSLEGRLKYVHLALAGAGAALALVAAMVPYENALRPVLMYSMVATICSFLVGLTLALRGQKAAKIYAWAWSAFLVGIFTSASIRFELVPFNQFTEFAGIFGALTTLVILSSAVSDIINRERLSRMRAQKKAIQSLEKYEALYESSLEGLFEATLSGELKGANSAFFNYLGYDSLEALSAGTNNQLGNLYVRKGEGVSIMRDLMEHKQLISREVCVNRKDGTELWASISLRLSDNNTGEEPTIEGSFVDITDRKTSEDQLKYLATHDPLTNLYNRRKFEQELEVALAKTSRTSPCSLFYMDLDQFKLVNDTCGHSAGDVLLKQLAQLMSETIGERGTLARLGGDEFGLLVRNCTVKQAQDIGQEVMTLVQNYRFYIDDKTFSLGISMGLVELSPSSGSIEKAMSLADTACYAAKDAGRNRIHVYSASNVELQQRRTEMELVSAIHNAIENDAFVLYQQLLVSNENERSLLGFEVLIRMLDESGELIEPAMFLPAAERYDLMPQIDRWVIEKSFKNLSESPQMLANIDHCSINLNGHSLGDEGFQDFILEMFDRFQLPYHKICFEITESSAIQRIEHTLKLVLELKAKGCLFSLDDFGSGFSSYGYLKKLPVDFLKIDGSFISNIDQDEVDYAMVKSIRDVANAMGMQTIAEYVENDRIVEKLKAIGVSYLQGYHIAKPKLWVNPNELYCNLEVPNTVQVRGI